MMSGRPTHIVPLQQRWQVARPKGVHPSRDPPGKDLVLSLCFARFPSPHYVYSLVLDGWNQGLRHSLELILVMFLRAATVWWVASGQTVWNLNTVCCFNTVWCRYVCMLPIFWLMPLFPKIFVLICYLAVKVFQRLWTWRTAHELNSF